MEIKEETKKMFEELFGPDIAKQLDSFDDPKKYPQDYLDECKQFMSDLIGSGAAEKKLEPLYKKYIDKIEA